MLLGPPGGEDPAVPAQHLQGDARRAGPADPGQRLSDAVGPPGRAAAQRGPDGAGGRGQLAQGQGLGEVHRRRDPRGGRPPRPGGVRTLGQLRAEEAAADRREPARGGQGRAPLPAVREEVLRLPPLHPDQRGDRRPGPRAHRLAHPRPGLRAARSVTAPPDGE
ncbi:hypothetical protein SGPA1_20571 [Streptomyces misionensis JCM 4497]